MKIRKKVRCCMHLFVSISMFFTTFRIKYSTKGCLKSEEKVGNTFVVIMQLQPIKIMRQYFIALFFSPLCNWPINRRKCTNIHMHSSKFQDSEIVGSDVPKGSRIYFNTYQLPPVRRHDVMLTFSFV